MKFFSKLLTLCLTGVLLTGMVPTSAYAATNTRKITVTGQGSVKVNPDIATINLGVTTKDTDAKTAQIQNTEITQKVLSVIQDLGISDKDIQTSYFSIYPDYRYREGEESEITGYTVTNSLTISVKDITLVGTVLESAIAAGANYGGGISFGLSDSQAYYEQALALAIQNAESKGKAIAKTIHASIGTPAEVVEQGSHSSVMPGGAMMNASREMAVPIQQGTLDVSATVIVTYTY